MEKCPHIYTNKRPLVALTKARWEDPGCPLINLKKSSEKQFDS